VKTLFLSLLAALAGVRAVRAADLIVNGSFEQPDVPATPGHVDVALGSYLPVLPGSPLIPGWKVTGQAVAVTRTPYEEGYGIVLAGDGLQSIDLTGTTFNGQGAIEQAVATTPGRDYALTFQLGVFAGVAVYSGPIHVRVSAGTTTAVFTHDASAPPSAPVWQSFALPFRASASTTTVLFENVQAAHWSGLDRVALADANVGPAPTGFSLPWWTVDGGGGTSTSSSGRFSLDATSGQPDAGVMAGGRFALFGGFWGPAPRLHIVLEGAQVRVSWDFGLGAGQLETTDALPNAPLCGVWTPVSLAGSVGSVLLPVAAAPRFFRSREN
jgi:hypothetical protein